MDESVYLCEAERLITHMLTGLPSHRRPTVIREQHSPIPGAKSVQSVVVYPCDKPHEPPLMRTHVKHGSVYIELNAHGRRMTDNIPLDGQFDLLRELSIYVEQLKVRV